MMMQLMPQDVGRGPMDGLYSVSAGDASNYDAALQGLPRCTNPSVYTMPQSEVSSQLPSPILPSSSLPTDHAAGFVGGARVPVHVEAVPCYSRSTSPQPSPRPSPRPSFNASTAVSSASVSVPCFVSPRNNVPTAVESLAQAPGMHGIAGMYSTEGAHASATAAAHSTSAAPTTPFILPEQANFAAAPHVAYTAPSPRGGNAWDNHADFAHSHSFAGGGSMSYTPPYSHHASGASASYVPPLTPTKQYDTWGGHDQFPIHGSSNSNSHTGGYYPSRACSSSPNYSLGGGGGGSRASNNFYGNSCHGLPGGSLGYGDLGVDRVGHFSGSNFATDPFSQTPKWPPACTSFTPHFLPGALGGSTSPLPPPPLSFTDTRGPALPFAAQAASARSQTAIVPGGALGDAEVNTESAAAAPTTQSSEKSQKERPPAPIKPSPQTKVRRMRPSSTSGCC
eukprot:CAMPEP_0172815168 /NCGR_PEP_ID=MMETSP1075-20121228/11617_1 /TAXON_ID=2916 /ORGANISM="Ceratium fusus, Strain PA161109" /LENGTH=450 /DNA_ID=CAMNT_0013654999 /DNA_START=9 /DNA_END=1358 /DNA_ORIENTATION=+